MQSANYRSTKVNDSGLGSRVIPDNSIKYSLNVKLISITAKMLESDLCIEIADHGIGIPRAEQAKVFEKFYRVGNGLVHDVKGSGRGLSLVKDHESVDHLIEPIREGRHQLSR